MWVCFATFPILEVINSFVILPLRMSANVQTIQNRVRWETWNWIFYFGLYFSYAFLYIVSGIFWIFKKRWCLGLQKRTLKLGISYWNSNFEVLSFVGCHTSRVAYWDSKTHGEGFSSIGLTSFELWPKNSNFLGWKILFFGFFFNVVSLIEANPYPWVL